MRSTKLWTLAAINALLLCVLVWRFAGEPRVFAQAAARPSDYVTVPGQITGFSGGVVYVVDTRNGLLSVLVYDQNNRQRPLDASRPINLQRMFAGGAGAVPGAGR